ncbi:MAG: hypothetical protein OEY29_07345 [Gammaproteobacteria bacterium]|nr:hypothetical protein [Gammaproteobacteria bacterium]
MPTISQKTILAIFCIFISLHASAEIRPVQLKPINTVALKWNKFVDDLLNLSNHLTSRQPHYEKTRSGGYSNKPNFYSETKFFNKQNNTLTSILQWENRQPESIHSIQVFLYDDQHRVTKDFSASYLTTHRNAPVQTLITLHYYNKDLHGFRVFDASHERIYEVCRGQLNGKHINIDLDDNYGEIAEALDDEQGIMNSAEYKACFGGRDVDMKKLHIPRL